MGFFSCNRIVLACLVLLLFALCTWTSKSFVLLDKKASRISPSRSVVISLNRIDYLSWICNLAHTTGR